jgi:hypothetical protein
MRNGHKMNRLLCFFLCIVASGGPSAAAIILKAAPSVAFLQRTAYHTLFPPSLYDPDAGANRRRRRTLSTSKTRQRRIF